MKNDVSSDRWWDFPAALLLLAILYTSANRLVATNWTGELATISSITFIGSVIGLALGQSRFSLRLARLFAVLYGLFLIPWVIGTTLDPELLWSQRVVVLFDRLSTISVQIFNNESVRDSLLFVFLMSILFWAISTHAGFTLTRHCSAWRAALPAGLVMFIVHSFDPLVARRSWYLAVYLFFTLVLVARTTFLHNQHRWKKTMTTLPPQLGLDITRYTVFLTILLVIFAWTAPALAAALPAAQQAWNPIQQTWEGIRDSFDNVFASLRASVGILSGYYGSTAQLGRGTPLTDSIMFIVKPPAGRPGAIRFYWRARTYSTYVNGQWISSVGSSHPYDPTYDRFPVTDDIGRWRGTFEFIINTRMATMFAPQHVIWVSLPATAEYNLNSDGSYNPSYFRPEVYIEAGHSYKAESSVSNPTIAQLKEAGENYPDWVTDSYLTLPDTVTSRTRELALNITQDLETPYDKVMAITNYLRNNITYVETIEQEIPRDQEIIDWFLFDLKQGFCNYYATAETILLRAIGIPARWSVGYAEGELSSEGYYVVRHKNAHAWPEVYFPGIGWVEFEPTASQPVINRLSGVSSPETNTGLQQNQNFEELDGGAEALERELREEDPVEPRSQSLYPAVIYWITGVILAAGLFLLAWRFIPHRRVQPAPILIEMIFLKAGIQPPVFIQSWARLVKLPPLAKAYQEINSALNRLGELPLTAATPIERATSLSQIVPPAENPANQLVTEYQKELFGNQIADLELAHVSAVEIRKLSKIALLRKFLARLQQPQQLQRMYQKRGN